MPCNAMMQVSPRYGLRSENDSPRPVEPICTASAEVVTGALNGASEVFGVAKVAGIEIAAVPIPRPEGRDAKYVLGKGDAGGSSKMAGKQTSFSSIGTPGGEATRRASAEGSSDATNTNRCPIAATSAAWVGTGFTLAPGLQG
jgi:hypothetical protein